MHKHKNYSTYFQDSKITTIITQLPVYIGIFIFCGRSFANDRKWEIRWVTTLIYNEAIPSFILHWWYKYIHSHFTIEFQHYPINKVHFPEENSVREILKFRTITTFIIIARSIQLLLLCSSKYIISVTSEILYHTIYYLCLKYLIKQETAYTNTYMNNVYNKVWAYNVLMTEYSTIQN